MPIYDKITDLVGNTPLVRLNKLSKGLPGEVLVKLEYFNPMASVKDRIALNMIESAECAGLLHEGSTIVEPTSGNTGIGLAFVCAQRGYPLILTMPDTMSVERRKLLKALGAEVVLTPGVDGMKGAIFRAEEIAKAQGAFYPSQFDNPANPEAHSKTTAEEIWADTDGRIDFLVAGVGTGGTLSGTSMILKQREPKMKAIAVEPIGSAVISGEAPGPHKIQGIGAGFIPHNLNVNLVDEVIQIDSEEAGKTARRLSKEEGILGGISSGANVAAALKIASRSESRGKRIVTFVCDTGERYLSTWLYAEESKEN